MDRPGMSGETPAILFDHVSKTFDAEHMASLERDSCR
jgi:hypothetical protein